MATLMTANNITTRYTDNGHLKFNWTGDFNKDIEQQLNAIGTNNNDDIAKTNVYLLYTLPLLSKQNIGNIIIQKSLEMFGNTKKRDDILKSINEKINNMNNQLPLLRKGGSRKSRRARKSRRSRKQRHSRKSRRARK